MRNVATAFSDAIAEGSVRCCELFEVTVCTGATYYFTNHNEDIIWGVSPSVTYVALPIQRETIGSNINLEVDTCILRLTNISSELAQVVEWNLLDNLQVVIKRALWDATYAAGMEITIFAGTANAAYNRNELVLTCSSLLNTLSIQVPRNTFQLPCNWSLFSTGCSLLEAAWKTSSTVSLTASDCYSIIDAAFVVPVGDIQKFHQGEVRVTCGNNNGIRRTILEAEDGLITVAVPFPNEMEVGDTYDYYPGCDKTPETCRDRFDNLSNFFGFCYLPPTEEALF